MHVHVGALEFSIVAAYVLIALFMFRWLATRFADRPFGKALATIVA